jgi:asparagine synthase (glutamine-hydrolysing)
MHLWFQINDSELESSASQYQHNTPTSKEGLYYRRLFEKFYSGQSNWIPYYWMPKWIGATDPSARTLKHYKK